METAVEWLVDELQRAEWIPKNSSIMNYVISTAKEMEKEQIINACKQCSYSYEEAEQYYNETFKSE
jgi:thiaminase